MIAQSRVYFFVFSFCAGLNRSDPGAALGFVLVSWLQTQAHPQSYLGLFFSRVDPLIRSFFQRWEVEIEEEDGRVYEKSSRV